MAGKNAKKRVHPGQAKCPSRPLINRMTGWNIVVLGGTFLEKLRCVYVCVSLRTLEYQEKLTTLSAVGVM